MEHRHVRFGQFRSAPEDLRDRVLAPESQRPVWLTLESFPTGTTFVPRSELNDLVRTDADRQILLRRWGTTTYSAFTRAFISTGGRDAFVYYEHYCGSLCGEGTALWLRWTPVGVWIPMGVRGFWVS